MAQEARITTRAERLNPKSLKLLEVNARYMRNEVFLRLVDNIRRDGGLTGNTPFAVRVRDADGVPSEPAIYEVLSGNHRVKAAVMAGLAEIDVVLTDDPLTKDRRTAIQLSHNALVGEDDPAILKTLYQDISDVDMRLYSGLDDKTLDLLTDVSISSLSEAALQFQTISLTFLPHEIDGVQAVLEAARKATSGITAHWLMRWADYDKALDALEAAGAAYGVSNMATALMVILDIFNQHMDDLQAGYLDADGEAIAPKRAVPVESILGRTLPARVAAKLKKAGISSGADLEALLDQRDTSTHKGEKDDGKPAPEHGETGANRTPTESRRRQSAGGADAKGHRGGAEGQPGNHLD